MANPNKDLAEEWRPVLGYEGLYEVSSLGRVKSVERTVLGRNRNCPQGFYRKAPSKVLKAQKKRNGYMQVALCKEGRMRHHLLHRLVIEAFCGPSTMQVNHINLDKTDNRLCNLEYMTASENMRYSNTRPVESYDLDTGATVKRYAAEIDVRADGFDLGAVNNCALKKPRYLSHHGLGWRFING